MIKDINKIPLLSKQLKGKGKVRIGIFGDNSDMANVMAINEYGAEIKSRKAMKYLFAKMKKAGISIKKKTGKGKGFIVIPERAPMRKTFDNAASIRKTFKDAQIAFARGQSSRQILDVIGVAMTGEMQETIASNLPPENHPYTTYAKGGKDGTLINTGRLRQSITYKVVK